MRFRMPERDLKRAQCKLSARRCNVFFEVVLFIPNDRHPCMCKLHPDLMVASGIKFDTQNGMFSILLDHLIGKAGMFCLRCSSFHHLGGICLSIL